MVGSRPLSGQCAVGGGGQQNGFRISNYARFEICDCTFFKNLCKSDQQPIITNIALARADC